ncbi:MAG: T9SS type A sorting domain-containing protein, partial [Bacteroidia bacterium]
DISCTPCLVTVNEIEHDFKFNLYPNPSSGNFNIIYLLPQNKEGLLEVFDINGRRVFNYSLPQWSTLQQLSLPANIANGLYNCVITSDGQRVSRKIAVINP